MFNKEVTDIITSNICVAIESSQVLGRDRKQQDFQYELQRFRNKLEDLKKKLGNTTKKIEDLKKFYLSGSSKKNVIQRLEKQLNIVEEAEQRYDEAKSLYRAFDEKLGKHQSRTARSTHDALTELMEEAHDTLVKARRIISKIAEEKKPAIMTTDNNELLNQTFHYLKSKELVRLRKRFKGEVSPKIGKSQYRVGGKRDDLLFARYLELINVPKMDGIIHRKFYLVFAVDVDLNSKEDSIDVKYNNTYVALSPQIIDPGQIKDFYKVRNFSEIKNALDHLAIKHNIVLFRKEVIKRGQAGKRLETLTDKGELEVLNRDGLTIDVDNTKGRVSVNIDRSYFIYDDLLDGNTISSNFDVKLRKDIHKLAKIDTGIRRKPNEPYDKYKTRIYERVQLVDTEVTEREIIITYAISREGKGTLPPRRGEPDSPEPEKKTTKKKRPDLSVDDEPDELDETIPDEDISNILDQL